jgi:hypothetical protein
MSVYERDVRAVFNADGSVRVGAETVREVPGSGWCLVRGASTVGAGFPSRDALLEQLLGPAVVSR